ncbi:Ig-like domain-containing protein [Deinococcus metallilatus]|uniref:Ig-like domain-containing protein n=1 Tax=Deinococcus metallilatus TaxID=1211322 RepID=UPI0024E16DF0|nr:Ig-like domain-containing protein [Deinococcus metallilatus]
MFLLSVLLSSCGSDGPPPSVAVITPSSDAVVSGTAAVQVTLGDDEKVDEVSVYARLRDSNEDGRLVGTVNTSPYIISWNTTSMPNGDDLEVYAVARRGGATGKSTPVPVRVQNATAPTLAYLVAYNLPSNITGQSLKEGAGLPGGIDPRAIRPPGGLKSASVPLSPLRPQATEGRQLGIEWAWNPVDGATGYRILMATKSIAGPYDVVRNQAASAGTVSVEKYSQFLTTSNVGDKVYGAVRSLTGSTGESALSNAGRAVFLDTQQVASPVDNQKVADGRPVLTWNTLPGAEGYLYFLCDRPCTTDGAKYVWTNYPNVTSSLSAVYPSNKAPLPAGTYSWWVAGVRFNNGKGTPVSLSYSEQRRLVVP